MLKDLHNIQVPEDLQLPLNPRYYIPSFSLVHILILSFSMEAQGLILEGCKYMDSKKVGKLFF